MDDLFYKISDSEKIKILKILEADTLNLKKGSTFPSTIKSKNVIGIMITGYIQIINIDYNGNQTIIEELNDNSIFGALFSYTSSDEYNMIVKEDSKVIIIDYNIILNNNSISYNFYNQFIKNLLQITTKQIIEKNERIKILTQKTIRNKILEYFNINSKRFGQKTVYLPFSFTEFAEYLSVDRSAMSRELKYLKDEGFIKINNRKIALLYKM